MGSRRLPEVVCSTSPIQYLHQLGIPHFLPELAGHAIVPPAVVHELAAGRQVGMDLPDPTHLDWVKIRRPKSASAERLVTNLRPGEAEVLMLALEQSGSIVVLDDAVARRVAASLGMRLTGSLGVLIDAERAGPIPAVKPSLDKLQDLRFRLAAHTRDAVLELAEERP